MNIDRADLINVLSDYIQWKSEHIEHMESWADDSDVAPERELLDAAERLAAEALCAGRRFNELWIRHTDGSVRFQPDGYDAFGIDDYHGDLDLTGLAVGETVAVEMNETHTIYIIRVA